MDLYYVTTNKGKIASLRRDVEPYGISVIQHPVDLIEPRSDDVQEIALNKMAQAYPLIKKPTVVLDAGFYIDSLNGFPKAFVNFALDTIGIDGMLKLVKDKDRSCEFRECLAYQDQTMHEPKCFIRHVRGSLAESPRGEKKPHHWSDLATIYIPEGHEKTHAEMTLDEYVSWKEESKKNNNSLGEMLYQYLNKIYGI